MNDDLVCLGDSRLTKRSENNHTSLCDVVGGTSHAIDGMRIQCHSRDNHHCRDLHSSIDVLKKTDSNHERVNSALISIGGNDLLDCRLRGVNDASCFQGFGSKLSNTLTEIKNSAACRLGNSGDGCNLFLLGAHALPELQLSTEYIRKLDSMAEDACNSSTNCTVIPVHDVPLHEEAHFTDDNIHLNESGNTLLGRYVVQRIR